MAFWGVEVKPGKPFAHSFDRARGRLRISQATLGIGSATNKSIVQCNVGNKSPVFLCALLPDKTESCHLDLEFEEADEILFSVIGPRSVHLTGYYLGSCRRSDLDDDTESYGEDIANTDTDESIHGSKEDEYEDSFIDDGAPEVFPPSPISNDDAPDEEMLDNKKPTKRRGIHKKLKKKYRSIDSDDDNDLQPKIAVNNNKDVSGLESEDEDNFPISSLYKSQTTEAGKKYDGEMGQSVSNKVEDDVPHIIEKIAKDNVVVVDTPPDRGMNMPSKAMLPSDGLVLKNDLELKNEKKERPGKGESLKTEGITCHETLEEVKLQCTVEKGDDISWNHCIKIGLGQKSATDKGSDQPGHSMHPSDDVDLEKHTKAKRKRKRTKEGKTFEDDSDNHGISLENDKALQDTTENKKPATEKLDDSLLPSTEAASGNVAKPKKRRKKSASKKTSIESGADCNHVSEYVKSNENKGVDLHTRSEEEKLPRNENAEIDCNQVNNGDQSKNKKTKKKKKSNLQKNEGNTDINLPTLLVEIKNKDITVCKDDNVEAKSLHANVLSNGLTVEELELGKPDGKVAVPGKKVKVRYIGKLKEKGKIFDSNIGKAPFKFRLGDDDVIRGWNIGLDGMRVGGKRRLIIPPSMGYGSIGAGENVPPNSWLVYEVELVGVR